MRILRGTPKVEKISVDDWTLILRSVTELAEVRGRHKTPGGFAVTSVASGRGLRDVPDADVFSWSEMPELLAAEELFPVASPSLPSPVAAKDEEEDEEDEDFEDDDEDEDEDDEEEDEDDEEEDDEEWEEVDDEDEDEDEEDEEEDEEEDDDEEWEDDDEDGEWDEDEDGDGDEEAPDAAAEPEASTPDAEKPADPA